MSKLIMKKKATMPAKRKKAKRPPPIDFAEMQKDFKIELAKYGIKLKIFEKFSDAIAEIGYNAGSIGVDVNTPTIFAPGRGFAVFKNTLHKGDSYWQIFDIPSSGVYVNDSNDYYAYYYRKRDIHRVAQHFNCKKATSKNAIEKYNAKILKNRKARWVLDKKVTRKIKPPYGMKIDVLIGHVDATAELSNPGINAGIRVRIQFVQDGKIRSGTYDVDFDNKKFIYRSGAKTTRDFDNQKVLFEEIGKAV